MQRFSKLNKVVKSEKRVMVGLPFHLTSKFSETCSEKARNPVSDKNVCNNWRGWDATKRRPRWQQVGSTLISFPLIVFSATNLSTTILS